MQSFADFLIKKLDDINARIDVQDNDDVHLLICGETAANTENLFVIEHLLIPLMSRFLLRCENCKPNPINGVTVQQLGTNNRFIVFMKQTMNEDGKNTLAISITAILP